MQKNKTIGAVIVAGTALLLAGCGSAPTTGNTNAPQAATDAQAVSVVAAEDKTDWTMPLDEYLVSDTHAVSYGEQLATSSCIEAAGYDWPVPWQDLTEDELASYSDSGQTLFNTQLAAVWGYHRAVTVSESAKSWDAFVAYTHTFDDDESFGKVFDNCLNTVRAENPVPDTNDQVYVYGLVAESLQRALAEESVLATIPAWRTCVAAGGIEPAASPDLMPTDAMKAKFGIDSDGTQTTMTPSAEEIVIATLDAGCAESSGYDNALYIAQRDIQNGLIKADTERFATIKSAVTSYETGIEKFISTYAPEAE